MTATMAFPQRPILIDRVSVATFRRRRSAVCVALAFIFATGIVATHDVLAGSGGVPASAADNQPAQARSSITAQPGDTLWAIAEAYRGDIPIRRYLDKLIDLNGGASIQAGQQVVIP